MTITRGIDWSVDIILPRILELKNRKRKKLEGGEVMMKQNIMVAGTRMMAGMW